jgi:hypothetical protein
VGKRRDEDGDSGRVYHAEQPRRSSQCFGPLRPRGWNGFRRASATTEDPDKTRAIPHSAPVHQGVRIGDPRNPTTLLVTS